jgi:hypothetical protein
MIIDAVIEKIDAAKSIYHRLVFVVAESGSGKTSVLQEVSRTLSAPLINVNLELSQRLLDLTERQRALQIPRLLAEIVEQGGNDILLLDNMEILFDASLRQDPLRLLQGLSRNRTLVVAWNGSIESHHMEYAEPGHPEHRRYPVQDFLVADLKVSA